MGGALILLLQSRLRHGILVLPPMSGEYIVKLALQDEQDEFIKAFLDFDRYNSEWSYEYGEPLDTSLAKVIGWIQLPEDEE